MIRMPKSSFECDFQKLTAFHNIVGSEIGKITKIKVSDCEESSEICLLKRFTNATLELEFELIAGDIINEVQTVVNGILFDAEIPFPLENPKACLEHGLSCPLIRHKIHTFRQSLPIKIYYPPVSVTVKWAIKDVKSSKTLICVLIPAQITLF
ncbi:NPC intracellular cholesterol transporter 2 homolog a-like [Contarinia nasturtii]|uniref:NPC intracellular cholesterol transporter 2 homolog a-like n=1 Tax=Contarinia nasturtii TaxID=265458 RepID=UPI0012D487AF|nr:NPC intracellular cholesterol transporter 2 homolog a-like [Contarinia nasturtii]